MSTTQFAVGIWSLALAAASLSVATAQNYPNKPIRIITSEAGGAQDIVARIIAPGISPDLGQPVIIENHPSALTGDFLMRSAPDGYTMASAGGALWLTPLLQKMPYDVSRDFAPLTLTGTWPYMLVTHPSLPVKSVKDLIALAKAKPGALNIGATAAPGGASFLATELMKSMAKIDMVRVSYKGNIFALTAVISGEMELMFNDIASVTPHTKLGRLRGIAVTSLQPTPLAPDMPTMAASGLPGYECITIIGFFVPAMTPAPIVTRLNQDVVRFLSKPEVKEKFANIRVDVVTSTPAEFGATIKADTVKWAKVLRDAGIKVEM